MASAHPAEPQSWNRYAYVLNNPLRLNDPTGMGPESPVTSEQDDPHKIIKPAPVVMDTTPIDTNPVQMPSVMTPIPTASGPVVPDDGTKPPPLIPLDAARQFADKALSLPVCGLLFSPSGVNGRERLSALHAAGQIKIADESVMVLLPDGRKVRLIDTVIGGTVVGGV